MKKVWIGLLIVLAAAVASVFWLAIPPLSMPEALLALQSDNQVTVTEGRWTVFRPTQGTVREGLVLYPGARVDSHAYAPLARAVAEKGFLVVIARMPLNLAVLDADAATPILQAFPEITTWAIGGHSLGGAIAANYIIRHPDQIQGLVLWAAYPSDSDDLSAVGVQVLLISASQDGLTTGALLEDARKLLPANTRWVEIEGGNHAQFGWYGAQPGDHAAAISREDQQAQIVLATVDFLQSLWESSNP